MDLTICVAWCLYQGRAADANWPAEFDKRPNYKRPITSTLWVILPKLPVISLAALVFFAGLRTEAVRAVHQTCLIFAALAASVLLAGPAYATKRPL